MDLNILKRQREQLRRVFLRHEMAASSKRNERRTNRPGARAIGIKQWLVFWAQFKKIHLDDNIDNDDKEGSSAKELVMSFPPTGENYPKVVEQLKRRFARDELLIEHYVRELLQLVITQTKTGAKMATRSLYDKLITSFIYFSIYLFTWG
ncbi:hypothetical protein K1T71_006376 [Dendrolimus kikuchii]|uniref:Uncharacterized protein n=1 Tax=Dendrolimus kikuchii TaxID=765133 RepID=A0ACC1D3R1_9NEOP|nr:hypothetical protein K1T71_006376 [Dendrolimus kikuchii]